RPRPLAADEEVLDLELDPRVEREARVHGLVDELEATLGDRDPIEEHRRAAARTLGLGTPRPARAPRLPLRLGREGLERLARLEAEEGDARLGGPADDD